MSVTGMVDKPMKFTMNDLVTKFETVTLLCTLVCAGNRRKEQNMVKKTKGFNWGASGTGTGAVLLHHNLAVDCTRTLLLRTCWHVHSLLASACLMTQHQCLRQMTSSGLQRFVSLVFGCNKVHYLSSIP